jgi:hypothetical protein
MKSKLGMAVMVLMAAGAFATSAHAQCGTGPIIEFDNSTWSYESNYDVANFHSNPGSLLNVVGKITLFCTPFADLDATNPAKEYTILLTNLVSNGTVHTVVFGTGMKHETSYSGGDFIIYEDLTPDSPTLATLAPNPPNAQVPATFVDGAIILSGSLNGFQTTVTRQPALVPVELLVHRPDRGHVLQPGHGHRPGPAERHLVPLGLGERSVRPAGRIHRAAEREVRSPDHRGTAFDLGQHQAALPLSYF